MKDLLLHFFNTVWSDAALIEEDNHFAFIDTGSKFYYKVIKEYLIKKDIKTIDFIILTHFHHDHYGNIVNLIKDFKIEKIYLKRYYNVEGSTSSGTGSDEDYLKNELNNYQELLEYGLDKLVFLDEIKEEYYQINFIDSLIELYDLESHLNNLYNKEGPTYHKHLFNENFNSMGVYIKHGGKNIYFGGDVPDTNNDIEELAHLGTKILKKIINNHHIDHFDICKAPHHGTPYFCTEEVAELLKTDYLIITNASKWIDNYPTIEIFKKIKDTKIYLTEHHKYIFTINENIGLAEIYEISPFFSLGE